MLCHVSPHGFEFLIQDHKVFKNNSNNAQTPVDAQLAVTLYCMGHFGNAASLEDLARAADCSEGDVELYTDCCFDAIKSLHNMFVLFKTGIIHCVDYWDKKLCELVEIKIA